MKLDVKKSACVLLMFALLGTSSPSMAKSVSQLQNEQKNLNKSINQSKATLSATKNEKQKALSDLNDINDKIYQTKQEIGKLTDDIRAKEKSIVEVEKEIKKTQEKLNAKVEVYRNRLVEVYKKGDIQYIDILFGAESFSDFLNRYHYIQYINASDRALIDGIKEIKQQLTDEENKLNAERQGLEDAKLSQENKKAELSSMGETKSALISQLNVKEKELGEHIAGMEKASADIAAKIAAIQASVRRGTVSGAYQGAYIPVNGRLSFPLSNFLGVTSEYGPRTDPFSGAGSFHMGIDLGSPNGSPVLAAGDGKIIIQMFHWSYGNYVVVDHGNGLSTLYAHMSGFALQPGSIVKAGQCIGYVGSTGSSTGAHLHFEVRINGQHTNPRPYLGL